MPSMQAEAFETTPLPPPVTQTRREAKYDNNSDKKAINKVLKCKLLKQHAIRSCGLEPHGSMQLKQSKHLSEHRNRSTLLQH